MQNYGKIKDEALVRSFQEGDGAAAEYLVESYKQTVRARARALYLAGGDREDLLQEGMIGLFRAIRTYRETDESGASFRTYATRCIDRQMITAVRAADRQKNRPLNASIPIHELEGRQDDALLGAAHSPETILLGEESAQDLQAQIRGVLSVYEQQVLDRYLDGMDYREIAAALEKTDKSVDNALQRIRQKVAAITQRENRSSTHKTTARGRKQ